MLFNNGLSWDTKRGLIDVERESTPRHAIAKLLNVQQQLNGVFLSLTNIPSGINLEEARYKLTSFHYLNFWWFSGLSYSRHYHREIWDRIFELQDSMANFLKAFASDSFSDISTHKNILSDICSLRKQLCEIEENLCALSEIEKHGVASILFDCERICDYYLLNPEVFNFEDDRFFEAWRDNFDTSEEYEMLPCTIDDKKILTLYGHPVFYEGGIPFIERFGERTYLRLESWAYKGTNPVHIYAASKTWNFSNYETYFPDTLNTAF